jgi:GWxTD domain-containing protein
VGAPAAGQNNGLDVTTARTFRAQSTQTVVDAFCRVPLSAISALGGAASARAFFRFAVTVRDSSGLALLSQSWTDTVAGSLLGVRGASTGEHVHFRVTPGRYSLEATVTDSATGLVTHGRATFAGFHGGVGASDLLLGTGLRASKGPADTIPRPGEIWNGVLFIQTSGSPTLTPEQTQLSYYLELYPGRAESLSVTARVLDQAGQQVIAAQPQPVAVGATGGLTYGILDLAGLPEGPYRLEVTAKGDSAMVRTATFTMAGLTTAMTAATLAGTALGAEDVFAVKTEAGLDSAYATLAYLINSQESGEYSGLTVDGKRRWLRDFWARRGPALRDQYYARVNEANTRFREGGAAGSAGWRSDRGRIFILYGPPDEQLDRRNSGTTSPYQVWKYTQNRNLKYVFMDLTRFGNFTLIYTNDRREQSRPDWMDLLGTDGVTDVNNF